MSIKSEYFIGLLFFSFFLVGWHSYWKRQNLKFIKEVGHTLERFFKPETQKYIWLGGVIGFHAEYETKKYGKVKVIFTTLPRQSFLYLPVALFLGRTDRLEILLSAPVVALDKRTEEMVTLQYDEKNKILFLKMKVKRRRVNEIIKNLRQILDLS